jgi:hypothetical protein
MKMFIKESGDKIEIIYYLNIDFCFVNNLGCDIKAIFSSTLTYSHSVFLGHTSINCCYLCYGA